MSATHRPVLPVLGFEGACDCHMHVYGSHYPVAPGAQLRPPDASVDDYRQLQRMLGTERVVVVTPSTYGTDNTSTVDAISAFGDCARGVAVVPASVTDAELDHLHRSGIRGIRLNLRLPAPLTLDDLPTLAARIAAFGWHVQLNLPAEWLPDIGGKLASLPVPLVFDHYGHLRLGTPRAEPAYRVIADLVSAGKAWVKLSGPYLESREGAPDYGDMRTLAVRYMVLAPERVVWGSDWPHPSVHAKGGEPIDDRTVLQTFLRWCDSIEAATQRVLVSNPQVLYGFPDAKPA
ncbi:amidohydrolase family protein [Cupriavidus sp. WKF15]|uniref:amidohydrolase family protein n=1 Tax=Cupriavidus sp. WKF15 TaxID=3032282 RepID=UPI0023E0C915|nr:amidohydrolase family protein [Cupriavidus sp. WKF15]WER48698.1 amidohydrolase family protein [Cupriavidus sp. WKF15]